MNRTNPHCRERIFHPSSPPNSLRQGLKSGLHDFPKLLLDGPRMFQWPDLHPPNNRVGKVGYLEFTHGEIQISIYIHFMVESWPQRFIGILRIEPQKTQHYECEVVTPRPSWPKKPFEQQTPKRRFPVCQSALKHTLNVWSVRLRWVAIFDVWEDGDDWLEVGGL